MKEEEQEAARFDAVFPCVLSILPTCIFNKKDPIVLGVEVVEGIAKVRGCRCLSRCTLLVVYIPTACSRTVHQGCRPSFHGTFGLLHCLSMHVASPTNGGPEGSALDITCSQMSAVSHTPWFCHKQVGTPVCVPSQGFIDLGRIASMELNHKVHGTPARQRAAP